MNVAEGLQRIRDRLDENDAQPATFKLVDTIARQPGTDQAQVRSLLELVRRLMRTPVANSQFEVYNDLSHLEDQLSSVAAEAAARRAEEESRPLPKSKKYYKELKERERKKDSSGS